MIKSSDIIIYIFFMEMIGFNGFLKNAAFCSAMLLIMFYKDSLLFSVELLAKANIAKMTGLSTCPKFINT